MTLLSDTRKQYRLRIPALHILTPVGSHYGKTHERMSEVRHAHSLLWTAGIKYFLQKDACVAIIHITTPDAPLLQAYQGGFLFPFPKNLNMNADLLRWLSSPKPRLVLPPIGGKLRANSIYRLENHQIASVGMGNRS